MREINSIVDDIHKRIDRIEGKYRHPKIKNSNENLLIEISKLKQQVQDYEKERQTFIVICAYFLLTKISESSFHMCLILALKFYIIY